MNTTTSQKDKNVAIGARNLLISNGVASAATWTLMVITGRYLGIANFGIFATGWTILNLFTSLSVAGLSLAVTKYIPEHHIKKESVKAKMVLVMGYRISLIVSVLLGIGLFFSADFISEQLYKGGLTNIFRIVAIMLPLNAFMSVAMGSSIGLQYTKSHLLMNISGNILKIATLPIFLILYGTIGAFLSITCGFIVSITVGVLLIRKVMDFRFSAILRTRDTAMTKKLILYSLPLAATAINSYLLTQGGIALLGILTNKETTGLFTAAVTLIFPFYLISGPLSTVMIPVYSKLWATEQKEGLTQVQTTFMRYLLLIMLPLLAVYISVPRSLLTIVYGAQYADAYQSLRFLATGAFVYLGYIVFSSLLQGIGKTIDLLYATTTGSIIQVVLIILLSTSYGITGAAIASMTGWIVTTSISFILIRKYVPFKFNCRNLIPLFIAFLVTTSVMIPLRNITDTFFGLLLFVIVGLAIYTVILALQGAIKKSDIDLISSIININGIKKLFGCNQNPKE